MEAFIEALGMNKIVTVNGETFRVRRRDRWTYDYDWVSGANPGYGFTSGSSVAVKRTREDHEEAIRGFLAGIDPQTGYLYDD